MQATFRGERLLVVTSCESLGFVLLGFGVIVVASSESFLPIPSEIAWNFESWSTKALDRVNPSVQIQESSRKCTVGNNYIG